MESPSGPRRLPQVYTGAFGNPERGLPQDLTSPPVDLPPFGSALCEVVEQTRPQVMSFHFGLPERLLLDRVRAAGCKVLS